MIQSATGVSTAASILQSTSVGPNSVDESSTSNTPGFTPSPLSQYPATLNQPPDWSSSAQWANRDWPSSNDWQTTDWKLTHGWQYGWWHSSMGWHHGWIDMTQVQALQSNQLPSYTPQQYPSSTTPWWLSGQYPYPNYNPTDSYTHSTTQSYSSGQSSTISQTNDPYYGSQPPGYNGITWTPPQTSWAFSATDSWEQKGSNSYVQHLADQWIFNSQTQQWEIQHSTKVWFRINDAWVSADTSMVQGQSSTQAQSQLNGPNGQQTNVNYVQSNQYSANSNSYTSYIPNYSGNVMPPQWSSNVWTPPLNQWDFKSTDSWEHAQNGDWIHHLTDQWTKDSDGNWVIQRQRQTWRWNGQWALVG